MQAHELKVMCVHQVRMTLRDAVRDIIHKVGVTSILVTHDQDEAFGIADKVVIFNRKVIATLNISRLALISQGGHLW